MTLAFLRLITNPRIFEQPEAIQRAWQHVEEWLSRPLAWISQPTERHREVLGSLLILCTTDGFVRFEGLRWQNPLRART